MNIQDISPSSLEAAGEMIVIADLIKKGHQVFKSVSKNSDFDLIVHSDIAQFLMRVSTETKAFQQTEFENPIKFLAQVDVLTGSVKYFLLPRIAGGYPQKTQEVFF